MTALERAATTVAACLVDAPVAPTFSMADVNGWTEEKAYEIARAVLLAVREPDRAMIIAGNDEDGYCNDGTAFNAECSQHWQAMIDAILNEKDATND